VIDGVIETRGDKESAWNRVLQANSLHTLRLEGGTMKDQCDQYQKHDESE
jgi:hypothetical protein